MGDVRCTAGMLWEQRDASGILPCGIDHAPLDFLLRQKA